MESLQPIFDIIDQPLYMVEEAVNFTSPDWGLWVYRLIVFFVAFLLLRLVYMQVMKIFRRETKLVASADIDALLGKGKTVMAEAPSPEQLSMAIPMLKKAKAWDKLGDVYLKTGKPKLAAKFLKKAGDLPGAAAAFVEAGQAVKGAKMMMKAGNFQLAGDYFMRGQKFALAAGAYEQQGSLAAAGLAHTRAGAFPAAAEKYQEYFRSPRDSQEAQIAAADACYAMVQQEDARAGIDPAALKALLPGIAAAYEKAQRFELAASLYRQGGELGRAGEVYVRAGKLQEAAQCYKDAGMQKEANRIGGRFYEQLKRFKEAAMAYAGAEEWAKAGECFSKSNEPVRAGECFEKAKLWFHSGLAYMHAGRYSNAVSVLQRVPENDPNFDASRALLGRSFYESHDYAHAAATLENHLLGKRVEKANIDYFYMLGLAKEQLGELDESKKIFLKIGAVDQKFRDIDTRVSSIDSRISILKSQTTGLVPGQAMATPAPSSDSKIMGMVENTLGARYEFERELGRGGMGVVYLARDKQLDRKVALKFLGSLIDANEEYKQRFLREARTAARINHPNIVAIYDISASEGKAYIAMEFIEGPNLFRYVRSKKLLDPREAANIMQQACSALDAMHEAGVVHRDIKCDNIVLAKGGLVKLMDFGLAKADGARITQENMVVGTPAYMSPEQCMGKNLDGRTDIYAMGLVLHEMLTGDTYFKEGDILKRQVMEIPKRPGELVEGIPPKLDEIVMKCVSKKPEDRYQKAREIVEALRAAGV